MSSSVTPVQRLEQAAGHTALVLNTYLPRIKEKFDLSTEVWGELADCLEAIEDAFAKLRSSDEGEPVDEDWLRSIGFAPEPPKVDKSVSCLVEEDGSVVVADNDAILFSPGKRLQVIVYPRLGYWRVDDEKIPVPMYPHYRGGLRLLLSQLEEDKVVTGPAEVPMGWTKSSLAPEEIKAINDSIFAKMENWEGATEAGKMLNDWTRAQIRGDEPGGIGAVDPVCARCGGSRRIPDNASYRPHLGMHYLPCPECNSRVTHSAR